MFTCDICWHFNLTAEIFIYTRNCFAFVRVTYVGITSNCVVKEKSTEGIQSLRLTLSRDLVHVTYPYRRTACRFVTAAIQRREEDPDEDVRRCPF
jgi:hypothetical protein